MVHPCLFKKTKTPAPQGVQKVSNESAVWQSLGTRMLFMFFHFSCCFLGR